MNFEQEMLEFEKWMNPPLTQEQADTAKAEGDRYLANIARIKAGYTIQCADCRGNIYHQEWFAIQNSDLCDDALCPKCFLKRVANGST